MKRANIKFFHEMTAIVEAKKTALKKEPEFSISCTFGPVAENGAGKNQKIGTDLEHGFTKEELLDAKKKLKSLGVKAKLYNLTNLLKGLKLPKDMPKPNLAYLLVAPKLIPAILAPHTEEDLTNELKADSLYDKKKWIRGGIKNSRARICCCVSDFSQHADYSAIPVLGTVHNFTSLRHLNRLRKANEEIFGEKAKNFHCELNKYHHNKAGIGPHGDAERKAVVCYKCGKRRMKLQFQWYWKFQKISQIFEIELGEGDCYVMSEYATGYNWKRSSIPTLRHSSGRENSTHIESNSSTKN